MKTGRSGAVAKSRKNNPFRIQTLDADGPREISRENDGMSIDRVAMSVKMAWFG